MESEHRAFQQFNFFTLHHLSCFGNTKRIEAFRMAPQDPEAFSRRRPKNNPAIANAREHAIRMPCPAMLPIGENSPSSAHAKYGIESRFIVAGSVMAEIHIADVFQTKCDQQMVRGLPAAVEHGNQV